MKKLLILFLFVSSFVAAQEIHTQTITVAADTGRSTAYTAGRYGFSNNQATPVGLSTPTFMDTDSMYIEVYNATSGTYQRLENANGTPVLYILEGNRTYYFDNTLFKGIRQFKLSSVTDVEDTARTYTIIELE